MTSDQPRTAEFLTREHVAHDRLWVTFAEQLEADNAKLREQRDAAEMACIEYRLTGGTRAVLEIASVVAQRDHAKTKI